MRIDRALLLFLMVVTTAGACMPRHGAPVAGARLAVGEESFTDDGPFRVVVAGPRGETASPREITIALSRPVRAPGVLDESGAPPASVTRVHDGAAIAGSWRWFGGRTAVFWPDGGFTNATAYRVTIDPALRALDGSALAAVESFELVTPRPALERVTYAYDEEKDRHLVHLDLSQTIRPADLLRAVRVEGRGPKGVQTVPFTLFAGESGRPALLVNRAIATLEDVTVVADATLVGEDGPLPSAKEIRLIVPDLGPLKVVLSCADSDAETAPAGVPKCSLETSSPELRFSKGVDAKDLARLLVLPNRRKDAPPPEEGLLHTFDLGSHMDLAPGRKYKLILKAGLRAADKEKLAGDRVLELETTDHATSVRFRDIGKAAIVEAARPVVPLYLEGMNVAELDATSAPLDDAQLIDLLLGAPRSAAWVGTLAGSATQRVALANVKNVQSRARFDLPTAMRPAGSSGAFAVATHAEGLADDVRILSVTDLGITSMWSPHGGLVWVTRLSTGKAVPNASVALRRAYRAEPAAPPATVTSAPVLATTTNADGIATIPAQVAGSFLEPRAEAILMVREGNDRTYALLPPVDPSLAQAVGTVFMDRRIYRPGETAFVKGFFRAPGPRGLITLAGRPVQVEAMDDEGNVIFATRATLDAFGAFSCELPIARSARLGFGWLRARVGTPSPETPKGSQRRRWSNDWPAHARFTIEEFRTVEFKVEAHANRPVFVSGETAQLTVHGKYLLGAPMHDVAVEISASRSPTSFTPAGLEDYATDAHGLGLRTSTTPLVKLTSKLGSGGSVTVPIPLSLPSQSGPETIQLDASIDDVSKAFAAGADTSVVVHPAEIILGLRVGTRGPVYLGKPVRAELVAAGWDGTRKPGVSARIELRRSPAPNAPPLATGRACDLQTTAGAVSCDLVVTEPGTHWLHASAVDAQGRATASATAFVVPPREPPPPPPPPVADKPAPPAAPPLTFDEECRIKPPKSVFDPRPAGLGIEKTDHDGYAVGQVARVCLRGRGDAILTLEREGVLRYEPHLLRDIGKVISIPITPELYPNVALMVHDVVGRTAPFPTDPRARGYGFPTFGGGGGELRVAAPNKKLSVAIETPPEVEPGALVETRVRVTDGSGRPTGAQVTLWAVDEGVFLLEPFEVPDPLSTFSEQRRPDVVTSDTRADLLWEKEEGDAHMTKSPSLRSGATSVSAHDHMGRVAFRPTAWFMPSVVTGPDGVAVVKARLPDNLTTWKVFAVASTTDDAFGGATSAFVANKPLMVRPALPRFLRTGDHVDATVIVDSLSKQPLDVKVTMRTGGVLAGEGSMKVAIPPEGHVPVRFSVDARSAGKGSISFRVEGPLDKRVDDVTIQQEVTSPSAIETILLSGETRTRVDEPLGDLSRARPDVGGFSYRLSTSPLVGLSSSLEGLIEYPYGCTEQLTSRLVPLLRVRTMARDLGVALPRDVDGAVRSSLASLQSHQRGDGGFGFWPASRTSEPWLTLLSLSALHAAKITGYAVPESAIDRALAYLEKAENLDAGERAMLEDLFAAMGKPRDKELRALAADAALPLFARALVARALSGVDRELAKKLLDGIASQARLSGASATYTNEAALASRRHLSSDAGTTAMALRAFVALDPKSPLVAKLVRGLLSMRREGRWPTTQASAWALLALDDARLLFAPTGNPSAARLLFDGDEIERATFKGSARGEATAGTLSMTRLVGAPGAALSFRSDGAPLFYEGMLRYARRVPPAQPLEHGIQVAKTMRLLHASGTTATGTYRVGDYVEVDVVLATAVDRDLVVLDDPLPAGFEAVNQSFVNPDRRAIVADASKNVTHRELRDDRVVSFFDSLPAGMSHTTYLVRAIAAGRFAAPPAKAECMYAADVFGRTAAGTVEVK